MFRMALFTQWKWTRAVLLPLVLATFSIPLWSVQQFSHASLSRWHVASLLATMQAWGIGYMLLSMFTGLMIAAGAWSYDTSGRHVYALSLPLPRWHYVLLRYGAGAVLLLLPVVFLWIGSLVATASAVIPIGLHAYPTALTLRYLLASFIIYSVMFALVSVPKKISLIVSIAIATVIVASMIIQQLTGQPGNALFEWVIQWPGFLEVYFGRWMLIDV
jgi:hypothetical protein